MKNILIILTIFYLLENFAFSEINSSDKQKENKDNFVFVSEFSKQLNTKRKINTIRHMLNRYSNNYHPGSLTGYSVPIQNNYSLNNNYMTQPRINNKHDLFSNPYGTNVKYRNGEYYNTPGELRTQTGVSIIYD